MGSKKQKMNKRNKQRMKKGRKMHKEEIIKTKQHINKKWMNK